MFIAPFGQRMIRCVSLLAACAVLTSLIGLPRLSVVHAAEPEVTRVLDAAGAAPQDVNSPVETTVRPQPAAVLQATQADSAAGKGADYFDLKPRTASELAIDRELQRTAEVDFRRDARGGRDVTCKRHTTFPSFSTGPLWKRPA